MGTVSRESRFPISGHLNGAVIGNDGIYRDRDCINTPCWDPGVFDAGPGQAGDGELEFWIPSNVGDPKFLWFDEQLGVSEVYNLNPR